MATRLRIVVGRTFNECWIGSKKTGSVRTKESGKFEAVHESFSIRASCAGLRLTAHFAWHSSVPFLGLSVVGIALGMKSETTSLQTSGMTTCHPLYKQRAAKTWMHPRCLCR